MQLLNKTTHQTPFSFPFRSSSNILGGKILISTIINVILTALDRLDDLTFRENSQGRHKESGEMERKRRRRRKYVVVLLSMVSLQEVGDRSSPHVSIFRSFTILIHHCCPVISLSGLLPVFCTSFVCRISCEY